MTFRLLLFLATALCASSSEPDTEVAQLRARLASLEKLVQQEVKDQAKTALEAKTSSRHPSKEQRRLAEKRVLQADTFGPCLDTIFLLICGALVMFMQAGFAILEAGSVTRKNSGTVLLKNLIDVCLGTLVWYFLGYGIAYGPADDDPNTFTGVQNFAAGDFSDFAEDGFVGSDHFLNWFFQWAFCATAATIVSGGVAERMALPSYILYSIVMTGVIYPFVVYWTWSGVGWLTKGSGCVDGSCEEGPDGYSDFAGSGIVHMTGGIGALTGAILLGPRKDRFTNPDLFKPSSPELCVLGTFILWFGWYGFNCGSQLAMSSSGDAYAGVLVAMNSTLAAASGGLVILGLRFLPKFIMYRSIEYDMCGMCNGILAGLVAVCAGVANIEPSVAILTGIVGAVFSEGGHYLVLMLKVDDPLDAFAVHGCGGIAGVLTRPLFDWQGPQGNMFLWHLIGLGSIVAWVLVLSLIVMLPLKVIGKLRIDAQEEEEGGDKMLSHSPVKPYQEPGQAGAPAPMSAPQPQTMVAAAPGSLPAGVPEGSSMVHEKYVGQTTLIVAIVGCCCCGCLALLILLCPVDERDVYVDQGGNKYTMAGAKIEK